MSEHLVDPERRAARSTPRRAAASPALEAEQAGKDRSTYREAVEKAISAIDARSELLEPGRGLPRAQARPRADGLLRPDRAGRAAGRGAARGGRAGARASSGSCCSTSTRTPRSPRPACCRRLFSGRPRARPRPRGDGGRRPQPGHLRLARRLGLQHPRLRRDFPSAAGAGVPTYPLTVNRRSDSRILDVANHLAAPLYDALRREVRPLEPEPAAGAGEVAVARPRDLGRRAGLAGRRRCSEAPRCRAAVARDRRADPRQHPRRRRLRRPDRARGAGRDRRPQGSAPAARGRRGGGHARRCCTTSPPTPRCSRCSPGRAGRSARATWRCSGGGPRELAGAQAAPRRPERSTSSSARSPTASTRPRSPRSPTRSTTPATCPTPPEARERFALLSAELRAAAGLASASRCSTWSGGSSTPPASTSSWPRRSARPPRPGATTSTCSSRRSRSSRRSTATVTLPALLAWLDRRGRPGQRASTSPPRPRPTRSSC